MPKKNNIFTIEPIKHERKAKLKCMDLIKRITSENQNKKEKNIKPIESIAYNNEEEETIIYANNFFESNNYLQENEIDKLVENFSQEQPEEFNKLCYFLDKTILEINSIENNNPFSISSGYTAPPNSPRI